MGNLFRCGMYRGRSELAMGCAQDRSNKSAGNVDLAVDDSEVTSWGSTPI